MQNIVDIIDRLAKDPTARAFDRLGERLFAGDRLSPDGDPENPSRGVVYAILSEGFVEVEPDDYKASPARERRPRMDFNHHDVVFWVKSNQQIVK